MSGAVGKATDLGSESAAGAVTAANVKYVMMARRRALRAVVLGSTQTRMFSTLEICGVVYGLCACHDGKEMTLYYDAPPRARGRAREYERAVVRGDGPRSPRFSLC